MQKWKMIEREIKRIFGKDVSIILETQHITGSHIISFKLDRINLNKDLLSKLASSSIIEEIFISPRSNWKDEAWMECFASGKKEDKRKTKEVL